MNKRLALGVLSIACAAGVLTPVAASAANVPGTCVTRHYVTKYHPAHWVGPYNVAAHAYINKHGTLVTVKAHTVKLHLVHAYTVLAHTVTTCY